MPESFKSLLSLGHPHWFPPWTAPTPEEAYRAAHPEGRPRTPKQKWEAAKIKNALDKGLLAYEGEPVKWSSDDVKALKMRVKNYDIEGPGKAAVCHGESGLFGKASRLLRTVRGIYHVEDAAKMCDILPKCTHFSITVGPDYAQPEEDMRGMPFRADFCKGRMVTTKDFPGMNTFVGVRKGLKAPKIDRPGSNPKDRLPDGPVDREALKLAARASLAMAPHPSLFAFLPSALTAAGAREARQERRRRAALEFF